MPTKRLPKTQRKQLEASLGSLTPKQAGKLFLLYTHEADRKKLSPLLIFSGQYRPIQELVAAQSGLVDRTSKQSVDQHNGFQFLTQLVLYVQDEAEDSIRDIALRSAPFADRLRYVFTADRVSEVAKEVSGYLASQPRPLKPDHYQRLLDWAEKDGSEFLEEVADSGAGWSAQEDGLVDGEYFELSFEDRRRLAGKRSRFPYLEDEQTRRDWLAEQDVDRLLADRFGGDPQRLEDWLVEGGHTNRKHCDEVIAKREAELTDRLTKAFEAGQLEGFDAIGLEGCYFAIRVDPAGRIPGWAALRQVWSGWLFERGYRVYQQPFSAYDPVKDDPGWPAPINAVYTLEGRVSREALNSLVGAFVEECRRRPWGDGLAKTFDVAAVARFLTAEASPLDHIDAPDLGAVDWKAFAEDTGEDPATYSALLSRSLEAARDQLGLRPEVNLSPAKRSIQDHYFPSESGWLAQAGARVSADRLATLRLDYPSFFYSEEDRYSPVFGEYKTPLENTVDQLGAVFGQLATLKRGLDLLSVEFFDGLPLLTPRLQNRLDGVEEALEATAKLLEDLLTGLEAYPWLVDVDRLKLVRGEADEIEALGRQAGAALSSAWRSFLSKSDTVDLGDGEFNAIDWLSGRLEALGFDPLASLEVGQTGGDHDEEED